MNPFRTAADMPGFVDRPGPILPTARTPTPADERLPQAVRPSGHWWQRLRRKVQTALDAR